MPLLYDYRLFISHAWKYGADYDNLVKLLNNANYFSYRNYSAPREKPLFPAGTPATNAEIRRLISQKIAPSQITIVIAGMYTSYREWMQYEIDESVRMGKPILGIRPWGNTMMPAYVSLYANETVGWNTDSIVSAIRRLV